MEGQKELATTDTRLLAVTDKVRDTAKTIAKPIVRDITFQTKWRISCGDSKGECVGELAFPMIAIFCAVLLAWRFRRRIERYLPFRIVRKSEEDEEDEEDEALFDMRTLAGDDGIVDEEELNSPRSTRGPRRHRRNVSGGSTDIEEAVGAATASMRRPRRKEEFLKLYLSVDEYAPTAHILSPQSCTHSCSHECTVCTVCYRYAPPLKAVAAWVKDVVPVVPDVKMAAEVAALAINNEVHRMSAQMASADKPPPPAADPAAVPAEAELSPAPMDDEEAGAPGVEADEPPDALHSSLHSVALAWRAVLADTVDPMGPCDDGELRLETLLHALGIATSVCELFGSLMTPAVKNDKSNCEKLRTAWEGLGRPKSLRDLLKAELNKGLHKPGSKGATRTLKDPSAAMAVVWVRRSLAFQTHVLNGVVTDRCAARAQHSPPDPSSRPLPPPSVVRCPPHPARDVCCAGPCTQERELELRGRRGVLSPSRALP